MPRYLADCNVAGVAVTDDSPNGTDAIALKQWRATQPHSVQARLRVAVNPSQLWPFSNKVAAVRLAPPGSWVALIDSDNYAPPSYFLMLKQAWATAGGAPDRNTIYCPQTLLHETWTWRWLSSRTFIDYKEHVGRPCNVSSMTCSGKQSALLNTGNNVFERAAALHAWAAVDACTSVTKRDLWHDSELLNLLMMRRGASALVVEGLAYTHPVSGDSFYLSGASHKKESTDREAKALREALAVDAASCRACQTHSPHIIGSGSGTLPR